jgi:hypothetical protein
MDGLNMGLMINSPVGGGQGKWVADAAATIKAVRGRGKPAS